MYCFNSAYELLIVHVLFHMYCSCIVSIPLFKLRMSCSFTWNPNMFFLKQEFPALVKHVEDFRIDVSTWGGSKCCIVSMVVSGSPKRW